MRVDTLLLMNYYYNPVSYWEDWIISLLDNKYILMDGTVLGVFEIVVI